MNSYVHKHIFKKWEAVGKYESSLFLKEENLNWEEDGWKMFSPFKTSNLTKIYKYYYTTKILILKHHS